MDGQLEESIYEATAHFGDFIQTLPKEGEPSTEKSDVWIFYDSRQDLRHLPMLGLGAAAISGWRTRCAATATSCATTIRSA